MGNYTFISHQGQSQIDLAITNNSFAEQVANLHIIPKTSSDHLPFAITLLENNYIQNIKQMKIYKYCDVVALVDPAPSTQLHWKYANEELRINKLTQPGGGNQSLPGQVRYSE